PAVSTARRRPSCALRRLRRAGRALCRLRLRPRGALPRTPRRAPAEPFLTLTRNRSGCGWVYALKARKPPTGFGGHLIWGPAQRSSPDERRPPPPGRPAFLPALTSPCPRLTAGGKGDSPRQARHARRRRARRPRRSLSKRNPPAEGFPMPIAKGRMQLRHATLLARSHVHGPARRLSDKRRPTRRCLSAGPRRHRRARRRPAASRGRDVPARLGRDPPGRRRRAGRGLGAGARFCDASRVLRWFLSLFGRRPQREASPIREADAYAR